MSQAPAKPFKLTLVELAQDKGWISQFLREIPDWMLREADRRAEQGACWQKEHRDPNRLPLPDPWQFLIDAPAVSPLHKKVCRAAQSQLTAVRKFCHLAIGVATLNTDWHQEALAAKVAGDKRRSDHAAKKAASALSRFSLAEEVCKEWVRGDPARKENAEWWQEQRRRELVKRGKGNDMDNPRPFPRAADTQQEHRLAFALVQYWLQMGDFPGLMFWRNEAAEKMVSAVVLKQTNSSAASFKKTRLRLGLIPADIRRVTVWDVKIARREDGVIVVTGFAQDGEQLF
ncbi:MAG: hypothetical protein ABSG04_02020 [Verrucomicrobiota bacterium]